MSHEPDPSRSQSPQSPGDDEPVPRLPRGRGIKLSFPEIMRILMILAMLIAVVALRRPCAENTGRFIQSFEPPADAGPTRTPGQLPPGRYIPLNAEMTEQELREKLELQSEIDAGAATGPATGAGPAQPSPAQPSKDTSHDREPANAPDRTPSTPGSRERR